MDPEFQDIEDALKAIRPASLAPAGMDRFLAAVEGRGLAADPALRSVENSLGSMVPLAVRSEAADAMLVTVSAVPFPVDEKVVLFPGSSKPAEKSASRRPWYAAAAAVAVAGAFSAMMVEQPRAKSGSPVAGVGFRHPDPPTDRLRARLGGQRAGGGQGRGRDVDQRRKPVRMVRVIYMDKAKYRNPQGEIIEVERPRVEIPDGS